MALPTSSFVEARDGVPLNMTKFLPEYLVIAPSHTLVFDSDILVREEPEEDDDEADDEDNGEEDDGEDEESEPEEEDEGYSE